MPTDADLTRRLRELEWLYASLQAVTGTLDLAEMLRAVLAAIKRMVSAEALSLLLYDPARDELVFAASETLGEETLAGPVPAAIGREPGLDEKRLAVALRRDGRRLGLLELRQRRDGRGFDEDDRARAEAIAAELAETIDPATLAHDVESLYRVFGAIDGFVPSEAMALVLEPEHGQELVVTSSRVLRPGVVDGLRLRAGQGIAGWVARNRQTVCVDDARVDPRHDPSVSRRTGLVARSMISVPLVDRDALLGVLQVINKEGADRFTQDDVRLVESLASQAAIAIAHAQLYRRAEIASLTDDLTGLGNTRRFNAVLPAALARGGPVSLLVLDLDALKSIVDRDGHLVGSRAIATVGRLISEQLRPGDSAARFGGDEFVAVLPETTTDDAIAIAQRIRGAVEACTTPDDVVADVSMLTASIGVATFPTHGVDAEKLFRAADRALYRIKFGGKNGVAVARGDGAD
jgi:diguanylate cyclase (GGDEF)-like protein